MRKKILLLASSFKASVCAKPTAMLMFIAIVMVVTIALGVPSRIIANAKEEQLYVSSLSVGEIDNSKRYDYTNYAEFCLVLDKFYDDGVFSEDADLAIDLSAVNVPISGSGKPDAVIDYCNVEFVIQGHGLDDDEIDNASQIMLASHQFMDENNIKAGDSIVFCGSEFTVSPTADSNNSSTVYIPFTAELADFVFSFNPVYEDNGYEYKGMQFLSSNRCYFNGMQRLLSKSEHDMLQSLGLEQEFQNIGGYLIMPIVILITMLLAGVINVLVVVNYIQKNSSRRFAIYKIIGMTRPMISGLISFESISLAVVGVGLGLLADILINIFNPVSATVVNHFMWLHCLVLLSVTLVTTTVTVVVKSIVHAKAVPVDVKYLA